MNNDATMSTLPWAFVLSAIAFAFAWRAWSAGDRPAAVRRLGWALLPWSLWLVGLLTVLVRVSSALGDWAAGFVFRPTAWFGAGLAVVAVLLIAVGSRGRKGRSKLFGRKKDSPAELTETDAQAATAPKERSKPKQGKPAVSGDDDMADIEAILRRHGIE